MSDKNNDDEAAKASINNNNNNFDFIHDERKTSIDIPDFEYDEDYNSLVADKELEDFQSELDPFDSVNGDLLESVEKNLQIERKIGNGNLTSDNFIDEDFEAELGGATMMSHEDADTSGNLEARREKELRQKIDQYGIVTISGSDHSGRPVIILSACNLPNKAEIEKQTEFFQSQQHFFDVLLQYLTSILDSYVESDYTLVYLHHGLRSDNKPSLQWLLKVYKMLDRKFKKNLKALYLVHPSYFIKLVWQLFKPFISVKFGKKVTYCNSLNELKEFIDVKTLPIPEKVKLHDMSLNPNGDLTTTAAASQSQLFKVPLKHIVESNNGQKIPRVVSDTIENIKQYGLSEEGIFRKSGNAERIKYLRGLYNGGQAVQLDCYDAHISAGLLKLFLRELTEPILTFELYDEIMSLQGTLDTSDKVDVIRDLITEKLPSVNYCLLKYIIEFLSQVSDNSSVNKMNVKNLSIVFGPNLLWPPIKSSTTNSNSSNSEFSLKNIECVNNFTELLIKFNKEIFIKE